jgi:hypothetical protein
VLEVSGRTAIKQSSKSFLQGIQLPRYSRPIIWGKWLAIAKLVDWGDVVYCIEVPTGLVDVDPRSL